MSRVFEIGDKYVDELAAIEPSTATFLGIPGHDHEMDDLSPDGAAREAELNRRTVGELLAAPTDTEEDRIAQEVMHERLSVALDTYEAGEYLRALRNIASPLQGVRQIFDYMPKETEEQWSNVAARLKAVPQALDGYRQTLSLGMSEQLFAAKRQAREGAVQARTWAGLVEGKPSYFDQLAEQFAKSGVSSKGLAKEIEEGVTAAKRGYGEMYRFLIEDYEPQASEREGVGPDRYELMARVFLGAAIDPLETYQWGWDEQYRIEEEMAKTAERIKPGASVAEVTELLETDPARSIEGVEAYREWLQQMHDEALNDLHGKHFDIPDAIRKIEVMIPPPGGALAPYYTSPSEDLSRPGRTWWPTGDATSFPKWADVSTVYHEGVPGHHLQLGTVRLYPEKLSRYQRLLTFISGHGEGWALYSERLMHELGYLENPDYYMGLLSAQALRAVRVIIDIGMHLELKIPQGERFHPGETWNHDLALEFSTERALRPKSFMASEVVRYLGWPAQAISYKVGERYWLEAREAARQAAGDAFDFKDYHTKALSIGPMGLAQLQRELGG
ncbi:MAG TPA: DUF885 domain-containing protein [Dehalococcoidia bacterium]|nr:DUF885 domain-containing protein [Dehalococcoidia bacterium]